MNHLGIIYLFIHKSDLVGKFEYLMIVCHFYFTRKSNNYTYYVIIKMNIPQFLYHRLLHYIAYGKNLNHLQIKFFKYYEIFTD